MRLALLFLISGCIARPPSVFSMEVQAPYRRHVSVPRLGRSDAPAFEKINQRLMALLEEWRCPDGSDGQSAYLVDGRIALRRGKIVGIDLSFDAMCSGWAHPSSGHEGLFFHATTGDQLKDVIAPGLTRELLSRYLSRAKLDRSEDCADAVSANALAEASFELIPTETGFLATPRVPYAVRACVSPVLLTWEQLEGLLISDLSP